MNRHTATIERVTRDRHGDPVPGTEVTVTIRGTILAPRASTEVRNYSDTVLSEYTLLVPADADIRATDEVLVDGVLYAVDGDPAVWSSPFVQWTPGRQVALRRVRG